MAVKQGIEAVSRDALRARGSAPILPLVEHRSLTAEKPRLIGAHDHRSRHVDLREKRCDFPARPVFDRRRTIQRRRGESAHPKAKHRGPDLVYQREGSGVASAVDAPSLDHRAPDDEPLRRITASTLAGMPREPALRAHGLLSGTRAVGERRRRRGTRRSDVRGGSCGGWNRGLAGARRGVRRDHYGRARGLPSRMTTGAQPYRDRRDEARQQHRRAPDPMSFAPHAPERIACEDDVSCARIVDRRIEMQPAQRISASVRPSRRRRRRATRASDRPALSVRCVA